MNLLVKTTVLLSLAVFPAIPAFSGTIVIDELLNGLVNGVPIRGFIGNDPGPGGLPNVAIYFLPFAGVVGDVLMSGASDGGAVFDVVRFNGDATVIFYSDNVPTFDAPADTPGPPAVLYANRVTILEIGPEGNNAGTYTPLPGQPGFNAAFAPTYTFISDGQIPEPATGVLIAFGLLGIGCIPWQTRRKR
jgi:hypothetical protein